MGLFTRVKTWADAFVLPASELNTEFDAVKDAVNNIEDINVPSGADIDCSKLKDDTLVTAKIVDDAITPAKVNNEDGYPVGWHGDVDRIKILPRDFISYTGDYSEYITNNGGSVSIGYTGTYLVATIPIPLGYKATAVMVYCSVANSVVVYECGIDDADAVSKGTGNANTEIDITDVTADGTNYLSIKIITTSGMALRGGYVTIEQA